MLEIQPKKDLRLDILAIKALASNQCFGYGERLISFVVGIYMLFNYKIIEGNSVEITERNQILKKATTKKNKNNPV